MAYDEKLADRIRRALGPQDDIEERKMFGGVAFLRAGRMFVGIAGDDLMVRVGPERYEESLGKPHVRPMDFTGRPMTRLRLRGAGGAADGRRPSGLGHARSPFRGDPAGREATPTSRAAPQGWPLGDERVRFKAKLLRYPGPVAGRSRASRRSMLRR